MTTTQPLAERFPGLDPDLAGMLEKAAAAARDMARAGLPR